LALQTDSVSAQSRRAIALLKPLSSTDPAVAAALEFLKAWNNEENNESAAAALYETWAVKHLGAATVAAAAPEKARPLIGQGQLEAVISFLESSEAEPLRERVLLASLADAVAELRQRLGPDTAKWSWGRLHRADFDAAAGELADPPIAQELHVGPLPVPGSSSTPRAATYDPKTFTQSAGASVRMVLDVGAWDNSMIINTPGQSGDPASPHYRDLFPLWAGGQYVPLHYSRATVDADADTAIALTPAR
jgi:penicillin amidase